MTNKTELLPCPFCSRNVRSITFAGRRWIDRGHSSYCPLQGISVPAEQWNTRTPPENARAVVEEPVAWMYKRKGGEILGQLVQVESDDLKDIRLGKCYDTGARYLWPREDYTEWEPLYRHPQRPVVTAELVAALIKATDEDQRDVTSQEWKMIREFFGL